VEPLPSGSTFIAGCQAFRPVLDLQAVNQQAAPQDKFRVAVEGLKILIEQDRQGR
jgi:hypothetical protein